MKNLKDRAEENGLLAWMDWRASLRPGEPCGRHRFCEHHVYTPCEGCGRYAAGMADGPPATPDSEDKP